VANSQYNTIARPGPPWQRSHAGAVGAEPQDASLSQELHAFRIGIGIGITRRLAVENICDESTPFRERPIVCVRVIAVKQNHIAQADRTVLLLESLHVFNLDQRVVPLRCLVEQITHIHDARFSAELPRFNLVRVRQSQRPRFLPLQFGPGD
jgi:hypothetical protein